jgi:peptide/nickel transport system permease protein
MVILGVLSWPGLARLTRGQILSEKENEFVTAAKAMGVRERLIIFRHILPNVLPVILVNLTLSLALCILIESSLSFLGFGVIEPTPTWGNMLNKCVDAIVIRTYWWRWVFPALTLGLVVTSINVMGDGFRDAIDPKSADR